MVEDISFHLFDLVQNSVAAGARVVSLEIRDGGDDDGLEVEVADDGRGMDERTLLRVQDPFFTSKRFKKVGLGIPLLKATAEVCGGDFAIASRPGQGTSVRTRLRRGHIDCPPLGDLEGTLLTLMTTLEGIDLRFRYRTPGGEFSLSSAEARDQAGGLPLSHPDVRRFLREFIHQGLSGLLPAGG
jgi:anti-sigma regulatory factor (Ser/Thr protein kinase)